MSVYIRYPFERNDGINSEKDAEWHWPLFWVVFCPWTIVLNREKLSKTRPKLVIVIPQKCCVEYLWVSSDQTTEYQTEYVRPKRRISALVSGDGVQDFLMTVDVHYVKGRWHWFSCLVGKRWYGMSFKWFFLGQKFMRGVRVSLGINWVSGILVDCILTHSCT